MLQRFFIRVVKKTTHEMEVWYAGSGEPKWVTRDASQPIKSIQIGETKMEVVEEMRDATTSEIALINQDHVQQPKFNRDDDR